MAVDFDASLLTLTKNSSATFSSSSNPCLDFFFQIVPDTPPSRTMSLLALAWSHDPLTALKLVFHLRGLRGTGKSNKEGFYTCSSWLHAAHPQTLAGNLPLVAKFGYYKDLLEIVQRELEVPSETERRASEREAHAAKVRLAKMRTKRPMMRTRGGRGGGGGGYYSRKGKAARLAKAAGELKDRETRIAASLERDKAESEKAAVMRKTKKQEMIERARAKYRDDRSYAKLHDAVGEIFARQLVEDKQALESKNLFEISFAAKWAPSDGSSYDQRTLMYQAIARRIFSKQGYPDLAGLEEEEAYAAVIGDRLRKEILVPLRRALRLPEVFMSAQQWSMLPYERVPSVAMKNYAEIFVKRDKDRYLEFLAKVAAGKKKVAAGAVLPHLIVKEAVERRGETRGVLAELQWKRMVSDLREAGSSHLSSSLAVCDVSGSMSGTPMEVCIALGLLVAELSDEPWKNHVCTFSSDPQIHPLPGESLSDRYRFTKAMPWNMTTDFQKVFSLLLELAQASHLPPQQMIQRLFVFSDMEFDAASAHPWETDYMVITRKFHQAGYGSPPQIVFWNLRHSISTPVLASQEGVALVSGFSKNLLKIFLENGSLEEELQEAEEEEKEDGEGAAATVEEEEKKKKKKKAKIDPMQVLMKAVSGELYDELRVLD